jgi:hypothetical protein
MEASTCASMVPLGCSSGARKLYNSVGSVVSQVRRKLVVLSSHSSRKQLQLARFKRSSTTEAASEGGLSTVQCEVAARNG